jgi:mono/diheme cytochrome c family protein
LYTATNCASCHGAKPDGRALAAAGKPQVLLSAIANVGAMNYAKATIGKTEAADVAEWLKNPK